MCCEKWYIQQQNLADLYGQGINDDYIAINRLDDSSDVDQLRDLQVHQGGPLINND
jgi:hypothetical protein